MANAHTDIEADLAYAEKLLGLTIGHRQETDQLLDIIVQLRGDVRKLLDENCELRGENAAKDTRIAELQTQVTELEARPTIYTDQLVGVQNVTHQNVQNQLVTGTLRKTSSKTKYIDIPNQLTIWPKTTTSL